MIIRIKEPVELFVQLVRRWLAITTKFFYGQQQLKFGGRTDRPCGGHSLGALEERLQP